MTKRIGDSFTDSNRYAYDGGDLYDPYFPNTSSPGTDSDGTSNDANTTNFIIRSQGFVKGSFTQVEVD